ncbi:hypothetical protein TDIS_1363 [Thermosulfurimonas dismutans]|uniref:Uncharacterized protein n=1 Tax=Thermosulfurimonas dismutans TaxID=999894 RepID=A0A179D3D9_9BACT|nr:hypothetical protein TDIS_1363 [Thermosulfurimonas dismutans]
MIAITIINSTSVKPFSDLFFLNFFTSFILPPPYMFFSHQNHYKNHAKPSNSKFFQFL